MKKKLNLSQKIFFLNTTDLELNLKRATEYITSPVDEKGEVTVFTVVWGTVPVEIFAGEVECIKDNGGESPCVITESLSSLLAKAKYDEGI